MTRRLPTDGRLVLAIGADAPLQHQLSRLLRSWGYEPVAVSSVDDALAACADNVFLCTLVSLPSNGAGALLLDGLRRLLTHDAQAGPIIALCENGAGREALGVVSQVVSQPILPDDLRQAIETALAQSRPVPSGSLYDPWGRVRQEIALWRSPKMHEVWEVIRQAAGVDVTVLVCGETGTGKDVVARAIHAFSPRRDKPFVKVNCAAVPRELLESELFGHERGAFTGAHQLKIGKFESADRGTVFLDEIGDLHPALQAKLLHVLQDGAFSRVGGRATIKVDVRVLAATNQDLERAVAEGRFRQDLYYRLNVIQVVVPPLRERVEEIPLLADYFVQRYAGMFHREGFSVDPATMARLCRHAYPGNVRELENLVKRMIVLGDPHLAKTPMAPGRPAPVAAPEPPVRVTPASTVRPLKEVARAATLAAEREAIAEALRRTGWNRVQAAKLLKISYRALLYKIRDVGLGRVPGVPEASQSGAGAL